MRRRLWIVALATLGGMLFLYLGPSQVGGPASYIVINGNSMEPGYHRGDLVIVRERADYQEGDIVAYRHPELGTVIHRVIDREGNRYVFQGDHNDFVDGYHPVPSEMVGSPVLRVPAVGGPLMEQRTAIVFLAAFLVPASVLGLLRGDPPAVKGRRRRRIRAWSGVNEDSSGATEWKR